MNERKPSQKPVLTRILEHCAERITVPPKVREKVLSIARKKS